MGFLVRTCQNRRSEAYIYEHLVRTTLGLLGGLRELGDDIVLYDYAAQDSPWFRGAVARCGRIQVKFPASYTLESAEGGPSRCGNDGNTQADVFVRSAYRLAPKFGTA